MSDTLNRIAGEGANGASMMPVIQAVGRAAIEIAALLRGAVFRGALGLAGGENVQGEQQEELLVIDEYASAPYLVLVDPLDGSSNLDVDGPVGTIFSVVKRKSTSSQRPDVSDTLQPGKNVIAAGYVLYGPATMLVCSIGAGVWLYL